MATSHPSADREREVPASTYLVSRTDIRGVITYANPAFIEISGFTRDELLGQPHNLVRHPDMPKAAFADLWATLKAGKGWVGVVKNRCANGDHYWVRAAVSPELDATGTPTGYVSVRTRPTRDEVAMADAAYRRIQAGERCFSVRQGRLQRQGLLAAMARTAGRLRFQIIASFLVLITLFAVEISQGLVALGRANAATEHLYQHQLQVIQQAGEVARLSRENWSLLAEGAIDGDRQAIAARIQGNKERISQGIAVLTANATDQSRDLIRQLVDDRAAFLDHVLKPGLAALENGDRSALAARLGITNESYIDAIGKRCGELVQVEDAAARAAYESTSAQYRTEVRWTVGLGLGVMILTLLGAWLMGRRLAEGTRSMQVHLTDLANGRLDTVLDLDRVDEFGDLQRNIAILQTRLAYTELYSRESREDQLHAFDRTIGTVLETQQQRIASLQTTATNQRQVADGMAMQAQSVSTSATELTASISEIANQTSQASSLAATCSQRTQQGSLIMDRLARASSEIAGVAKLIGSIASRTNLLALNATIEAASAGEAGRGFAVVAGEVKDLAKQVATATSEINDKITAILSDSRASQQALQGITESVEHLSRAADSIAAAVEQQSTVVAEVAQRANESTAAAQATGSAAAEIGDVATTLAGGSQALNTALLQFKAGLRT